MAPINLLPVDALEVHVIVDNEVDPLSSYAQIPDVEVTGRFVDLAMTSPFPADGRGTAKKEMKMELLCCGAHGLSLMIVSDSYLFPTYSCSGSWVAKRVWRRRPPSGATGAIPCSLIQARKSMSGRPMRSALAPIWHRSN